MLANRLSSSPAQRAARQRGMSLMLTLIVLLAMMLAAIGVIRSADTSNIIAGNLSFQQAAVHSGDTGIEAAAAWLEGHAGGNLWNDNQAAGYHSSSTGESPAPGQSWDDFWTAHLQPWGVVTLPMDAAGNTVAYTIHRMCPTPNAAPMVVNNSCASSTQMVAANNGATSQGAGQTALIPVTQQFYRITIQIRGPRNTLSYVQAMVAL